MKGTELFGHTAKDAITGFTGIVTGWCRYMTGCDQYCLTPPIKADGTKADSLWFDENRILLLPGVAPVVLTPVSQQEASVKGAPSTGDEMAPSY